MGFFIKVFQLLSFLIIVFYFIYSFPSQNPLAKVIIQDNVPSDPFEQLQKNLALLLNQFTYLINNESKLFGNVTLITERIPKMEKLRLKYLHQLVLESSNLILNAVEELAELDGFKFWRFEKSKLFETKFEKQILTQQYREDCHQIQTIIGDLSDLKCGFGCQLYYLVESLMMAYKLNRTFVLASTKWNYLNQSWDKFFQPISHCTVCNLEGGISKNMNFNKRHIHMSYSDILKLKFKTGTYTINELLTNKVVNEIQKFHGNPYAFFVGLFVKYLIQTKTILTNSIQKLSKKINFQQPVVGIQIRRTDKIREKEIKFHWIDEYMRHVEDYFARVELRLGPTKRRIYIATDDPSIFQTITKSYPGYTVLGDPQISQTAENSRFSPVSLIGLMADLYFLSKCDLLVCSFASNICRVAYELKQLESPDATNNYRSLDDIYYYLHGKAKFVVMVNHTATMKSELNLVKGDTINVVGNLWNGFSLGENYINNKKGYFPSFKVENLYQV